MLDPYREVMTGGSFGGFSFGLQTFEAFIQYQESTDFIKAMESLRGMKLMLKGDDGKALACNIKVGSIQTLFSTVQMILSQSWKEASRISFFRFHQALINPYLSTQSSSIRNTASYDFKVMFVMIWGSAPAS
jgi:hypothetical protein